MNENNETNCAIDAISSTKHLTCYPYTIINMMKLSVVMSAILHQTPSQAFTCHSTGRILFNKDQKTHHRGFNIRSSHDSDLDDINIIFDEVEMPTPSKPTWDAGDDWSALSSAANAATTQYYEFESSFNAIRDAERILSEQDGMTRNRFDEWVPSVEDAPAYDDNSPDEVDAAVDTILNHLDYDADTVLYDTKSSESSIDANDANMDQDDEMVYMIRCNQTPEQFLVSQGKVLPELTEDDKYSVEFLLESVQSVLQPIMTPFFEAAVYKIFNQYSAKSGEGERVMDRSALASWMTTCLSYDPSSDGISIKIGSYDSNISMFLSRYCRKNGLGQLSLDEFSLLYLECAWVGHFNEVRKKKEAMLTDGHFHPVPSLKDSVIVKNQKTTDNFLKDASLNIVWRDLEAHG